MKAMILAAGRGRRLSPLTDKLPKPMIDINGKPIIYYQLKLLKKYNIKEVVINLNYMPWKIKNYLGSKKFGIRIRYSYEKKLLGTAGAVKKVEKIFDADFFVVYGDIITDMNLIKAYGFHKKNGGIATICLHNVPKDKASSSIIILNKKQQITKFIEKPKNRDLASVKSGFKLVNSGIYILKNSILRCIPKNSFSDFALDVFPMLLKRNEKLVGYFDEKCHWAEIGRIEKYNQIKRAIEDGKFKLNL